MFVCCSSGAFTALGRWAFPFTGIPPVLPSTPYQNSEPGGPHPSLTKGQPKYVGGFCPMWTLRCAVRAPERVGPLCAWGVGASWFPGVDPSPG